MPSDYTVRQGDCIASIAYREGFFWETLWSDSANSELRRKREVGNVLAPGDVVHIPDLRKRAEAGAAEQKHRFRRKGVPAILRLQILGPPETDDTPGAQGRLDESEYEDPTFEARIAPDEPLSAVPYRLVIDGESRDGKTDGQGRLEVPIPPDAQSGRVILNPDTEDERVIGLRLGAMDPIEEDAGVAARLNNLGFPAKPGTPPTADTVRLFQEKNGLDVTGKVNDATRLKLTELNGS